MRLRNSHSTRRSDRLEPLRAPATNELIEDFPESIVAIDRMAGEYLYLRIYSSIYPYIYPSIWYGGRHMRARRRIFPACLPVFSGVSVPGIGTELEKKSSDR